jgi:hypothetical protein
VKIAQKIHNWLGRLKYRYLYQKSLGALQIKVGDNSALVSYFRDGKLDYDTYKAIQQAGNRHKLNLVSADVNLISRLSAFVSTHIKVGFVLCHGTRNGAELGYFKRCLPGATVLGTEISDTATQFKDTIQWDFHEVKPEWIEKVDLLYSNSWDHTYDPIKLFKSWAACIAPDGFMAIDHTKGHMPERRDVLDPFGITIEGLIDLVTSNTSMTVKTIINATNGRKKDRKIVLFSRIRV